ncbi:RHS repeat domain-containing protein [Streptomyces sp. NPDC088729]|uniref:RHS repeat domain-containing protein n=1 Tax=Streptomyces sp. NPDC088729 TaxID=3365876 RepID=UPI00380FABB3
MAVSVAVGASLPWVVGVGGAFAAPGGEGSISAATGSLGGAVDERTGEARFSPALGGVSGAAGSGLQLKAQFSQRLSSAGVNRFGLGQGMSLGLPFVDVERGTVVLPSGEQVMDSSKASGFKDYPLKDVEFRAAAGPSPVTHAYEMKSLKDGSRSLFDSAGDLVAVEDRFGHLTKLVWTIVNGQHRLSSVTGGWGSKLTVRYRGDAVTFVSPKRWGQTAAPETVVRLDQGRVKSVTDPAGARTDVEWAVKGAARVNVPSAVTLPTGARTEFDYREYEPRSGAVVAVSAFEVKDSHGGTLTDRVSVSLDPDGANGGRNFTGCPQYCADGTDGLENSGDGSFSYRVRFAQRSGQETERSYNALHLQKSEVVRVRLGSQTKEVSRTDLSYPGEGADGAPPKVKNAPANYQTPSRVEVTTTDPEDATRKKTSEVSSEFDAMGRQISQTRNGVRTTTEFGANSLPVRTETKDIATGAREVVENALTGDGKAVARTVTKAAQGAADDLGTVSSQEFEYHGGELAGEVAKTTVTGDSRAKGGDPGPAVTSTASTVEKDAAGVGRRTDKVTGADGVTTTTVSDLAGGVTLSEKTGDLAEEVNEYDVADRLVKTTADDGTVTRASYETRRGVVGGAPGGTSTTSRRESDGFASRTVTDELGRRTASETNYQPSADGGRGAMLPEGQWRPTGAAEYNTAGQQVKSVDAGGRETTVEHDAWGIPAKTTGPDGTVTFSNHDDVAGTATDRTVPGGQARTTVTSSRTVDDRGNPVGNETTHGDGTPGIAAETVYDAFGRPTRSQDDTSPFTAERAYTAAGLPQTDTLAPKEKGSGTHVVADYVLDAFGNKTQKTLSKGAESAEGWKTVSDTAGRTKEITAPGGAGTSSMTYGKANGLVESVALPDGSVAHQRVDASGRGVEAWVSPKDDPGARREHVRTSYDPVTGQKNAVWRSGDEAGSKITFAYHPDSTVKERVDPGGKRTSYTYNDEGKPATVTDHTGAVTSYTYDGKSGRMTQAVQSRAGKELARVSYAYDASGRPEKIDRGNGAVSTYTFNDAGLPTGEKHTAPGGRVIAEHAYSYTPQRQLATDVATLREKDGSEKRTATAHTYDTEKRLTRTHVTEGHTPGQGTLVSRSDYAYDLVSNLSEAKVTTRAADGTEKTATTGYEHDAASRTTHITEDGQRKAQTYDSAGRLTRAADGTTHTYDAGGQLTATRAPDGTTVTNTYNAAGERDTQTTRTPDGTENTLTYRPGTETGQDGTTASYLTGRSRESRTLTPADGQNPQTGYYLTNRRGDKTHTLDASGTETGRTAYTDYGRPITPTPRTGSVTENPYGYAGEYTTPSGHQSLGSRWYDTRTAAFTGPDAPVAGMLNPYTYATGDPVNYTDPTGQSPEQSGNWFTDSWFNKEVLGWEGMPYLDIALAAAGIALTAVSGGAAAPAATLFAGRAIKAALTIGTLATIPAAADQIAINTTGQGFMPENVRTGFDVAALAGGITGGLIGIKNAPGAATRIKQFAGNIHAKAFQAKNVELVPVATRVWPYNFTSKIEAVAEYQKLNKMSDNDLLRLTKHEVGSGDLPEFSEKWVMAQKRSDGSYNLISREAAAEANSADPLNRHYTVIRYRGAPKETPVSPASPGGGGNVPRAPGDAPGVAGIPHLSDAAEAMSAAS